MKNTFTETVHIELEPSSFRIYILAEALELLDPDSVHPTMLETIKILEEPLHCHWGIPSNQDGRYRTKFISFETLSYKEEAYPSVAKLTKRCLISLFEGLKQPEQDQKFF